MTSITWCKQQKKGLQFTAPNHIISADYIRKANESLQSLQVIPSEEWKVVMAYYACYNSIYALLQHAGIICEIHDCTLALLPFFHFTPQQIAFIENLKTQRINAQYYANKPFQVADAEKIKSFVLDCKQKLITLDFTKIKENVQNIQ